MRLLSTFLLLSVAVACDSGDDKSTSDTDTTDTDTTDTEVEAEGVDCNAEGDVCVLSGVITSDLELSSDVAWLLRGGVFIGDDVNETVLTIEAGTTIYGEASTDGMLVIRRGSKIEAVGTAEAPIVFTSSQSEGSRARGDWGGIIINGKSSINSCGDEDSEDCEAYGEGGTGWYGGSDDTDSSGTLKYVRVEFAGTLISPDNELNGIAFQGVGSETEIDYIQVHMNADDGVEFFGGTTWVKHLVVTGVADDCFDWTDGWRGGAQHVVLQQYDGAGDQGIEADNNGDNNEATPISYPTLANFTIVGSPDSEKSDLGILLREGTKANIYNTIVTDFNQACLAVDHNATFANLDAGELEVSYSILNCATNYYSGDDDYTDADVEDWFTAGSGNWELDPELADATNESTPDWQPASTSGALGNGLDVSSVDSWFDSVDYIGAFDGSDDWTAGWIETAPN